MRIGVVGAGGVGGYLGARLAQAGHEVVFIARGDHLRAIQAHGLQVHSPAGTFTVQPARATDDPRAAGPVEIALVAVKAWQTPQVAETMRPLVGDTTTVAPLLNGVEAPTQLATVLGAERVVGGLCHVICYIEAPGVIRHVGGVPDVAFGEMDGSHTPRIEQLIAVFERASIRAIISDDIQAALWQKLLFVEGVGAVGAISRAPLGVIRSVPEARQLVEMVMRETCVVANARGATLGERDVADALRLLDNMPTDGTASMQRDIRDSRPSELDAQTGAVMRLGHAVGVATPLHDMLYAALLPQELRARGKLQFAS
ncbi:MAG: 2-dehydropantoate 2-reductase [Ktedonobacterales bacterium]